MTQGRLHKALHRLVLCALLVALPIYGAAGTLVGLLGVRHVHLLASTASESHDAMAGWSDLRRAGLTQWSKRAVHSHAAAERHRHLAGDGSVVPLDGGAQAGDADSGNAAAGSLAQAFALAGVGSFPVALRGDPGWLHATPVAVSRWIAAGPERPPRT